MWPINVQNRAKCGKVRGIIELHSQLLPIFVTGIVCFKRSTIMMHRIRQLTKRRK